MEASVVTSDSACQPLGAGPARSKNDESAAMPVQQGRSRRMARATLPNTTMMPVFVLQIVNVRYVLVSNTERSNQSRLRQYTLQPTIEANEEAAVAGDDTSSDD